MKLGGGNNCDVGGLPAGDLHVVSDVFGSVGEQEDQKHRLPGAHQRRRKPV